MNFAVCGKEPDLHSVTDNCMQNSKSAKTNYGLLDHNWHWCSFSTVVLPKSAKTRIEWELDKMNFPHPASKFFLVVQDLSSFCFLISCAFSMLGRKVESFHLRLFLPRTHLSDCFLDSTKITLLNSRGGKRNLDDVFHGTAYLERSTGTITQ